MAKTLKQILQGVRSPVPKSDGDQKFVDNHSETPAKDDKNGNDDKLFNASNVKVANRFPRHGYDETESDAVYIKNNGAPVKKKLKEAHSLVSAKQAEFVHRQKHHTFSNVRMNSEEDQAKLYHLVKRHAQAIQAAQRVQQDKALKEGVGRALAMGAASVAAGAVTGAVTGLGAIPGATIAGLHYLATSAKTDLTTNTKQVKTIKKAVRAKKDKKFASKNIKFRQNFKSA